MKTAGQTIFSATAALLDGMPGPVRRLVSGCAASGYYLSSGRRRRAVRENIETAGAEGSRGAVYGIYRCHALNMIDMFRSSRWDREILARHVELPCRDLLDEALAAGRGAIFATAHIGNWELPALYLASLGYRLHAVAGVQMNPLLTGPLREAKERRGIAVIGPGSSYRRLLRALGAGGIVALLVDGDVYTGGAQAELLGRRIVLPGGAARLAAMTGAPVIGAYCRRIGDDRSRIHMERVLGAGEAADIGIDRAHRMIAGALGRFIAGNSDQWCLFRPFWRDAP
ncbi:MAG: lysophospholipid acyltransferase family protein [Candidatus Krumholzibacteria bacterium]|nr:lysophospholipid acyltransferase family protein [Candidatus Krumholzibacteria bacterium]